MNLGLIVRKCLGRATCIADSSARIASCARIYNIYGENEKIRISDHTIVRGELLVFAHGGQITVGSWCFIGEGSRIWSGASISIGDRVMISHNVNIFDNQTHPMSPSARHKHFRSIYLHGHPKEIRLGEKAVVVEDDAWISAGSTILKGVRIGRGAIVGAGSVVTADVAEYSIVGGNPARHIRDLEPEERI